MSKALPLTRFVRLMEIFNLKEWSTFERVYSKNRNRSLFSAFCELLTMLNDEQQELLLLLTEDYQLIQYTRYLPLLEKAVKKIPERLLELHKNIFLVPIKTQVDKERRVAKSGDGLPYLAKNSVSVQTWLTFRSSQTCFSGNY